MVSIGLTRAEGPVAIPLPWAKSPGSKDLLQLIPKLQNLTSTTKKGR